VRGFAIIAHVFAPHIWKLGASSKTMYHKYFQDSEVKSEFQKEYISLWSGGWLGKNNQHKLDSVTEHEWQRFHNFLVLLESKFQIQKVNCNTETLTKITNVSAVLDSYEQSLNKDSSQFYQFVVPELECVISEEWDYTYIVWYRDNKTIAALAPYIKKAGLCHFS